MDPRPYQKRALVETIKAFQTVRSALDVLPTGTGKTIIFCGIAFRFAYKPGLIPTGNRVLILAHQDTLIDQAAEKLEKVMGIKTSREKGKQTIIGSDLPVSVSSVQTMQRRLEKFEPDFFSLIIIDEAHHAMSAGYQKIINYFSGAKIFGVTATPDRADGKKLECFESIAFQYSIEEAQADGYLAPLNVVNSAISIDLGSVRKKSTGDLAESSVADAIEPHLNEIAEKVRELAKGRRIVCFVPLVKTARKAEEIFSHYGFKPISVCGKDPDRKERMAAFARGEYDIIFNAMILTEGWDCPETDCVIVLRPTTSRALYVQMIGRGLRLAEGKKDCLLIDFLYQNSKFKLASPKDVLGKNIEEGSGGNSREGEGPIPEDRETVLIRKLKAAALAQKMATLPEAREMFPDLLTLAEADDWLDPPCTDRQRKQLIEFGYSPIGLSAGQATNIINHLKAEKNAKEKPSDRQIWRLRRLGFSEKALSMMNKAQATKELQRAKVMGRW